MPGHRRISTDLFLEHAERRVPRSKVEALLELDLDAFRGALRGERTYASLWGWSRDKVRHLLAQYRAALSDLGGGEREISHPTTYQTTNQTADRPAIRPPTDHDNAESARTYEAAPTSVQPETRPEGIPVARPQTDHFLEPEQEQEGKSASPPRPKAARVGKAEAQKREARAHVQRALMRLGPMEDDARDDVEARLGVLAEVFLTCGEVANDSRLLGYARGTSEIPTPLLRRACDQALAASEKGFPPPIKAIGLAGRSVVSEWRRQQRAQASQGPA